MNLHLPKRLYAKTVVLAHTQDATVPSPPPPPIVPSPPGPPARAPPPPPAPLAGNGSTTLVLEVFYNQVTNWFKQCSGRTLYFVATVGATTVTTNPVQVSHS